MTRISSVFQSGHTALITYITVGYPSIEATLKVVPLLADSGCDIVELGIPFSDPLADGVTIQKASFYALKNGVTTKICLEIAEELSQKVKIPLVFMTYFNPVSCYGLEEFCSACSRSGINGLIIPDLPPDESSQLEAISRRQGLDLIYLLAPTSTEDRIRLVAERSSGFIYLVSVTGVTGTRDSLPPDLDKLVAKVRRVATQPLCVGFGISNPEQARQLAKIADGVIVGSPVSQLMEIDDDFASVVKFAKELRHALDKSHQ
ncbi:MAG: tryptophan synthase subunit alpha [Chloroflexi bacterium RBG_19FT_COMBO_47_15]|nr:MAG: tryptophan synthase subunit alpha [Chloroflexi bacterium RBG_19FT_COMBO_47_15]